MQDVVNPLQKQSYCNKDFQTIYPEMLDLVKTLTKKWDPSISNESDPGVILLKLAALIGDKVNYNTDTAILETFPISVTQSTNARKLFEQLGYYMHWYKSATCDVSFTWIATEEDASSTSDIYYTIPKFTTVTDETSTIVYTLIGPADGVADDEFNVSDMRLYRNGDAITFKAIQGLPVNYSINGVTTITYDMLDSNNRIYFPYSDVAENGIFICNEGYDNYNTWIRKNNLAIEDVSSKNHYYRFGVSQDNLSCYLEFPVNIEELMNSGLNITFIRSSGESGDVAASMLVQTYSQITPAEDTSISIDGSTALINNPNSGTGGKDPESIDDAYRNYKQTVGTFKTLITLRDYLNYVLQSGLVSNGFVCDRTNDIQCVTKVMNTSNSISQRVNEVSKHSKSKVIDRMYITTSTPKDGGEAVEDRDLADVYCDIFEDDLTAFSLKFYLLNYSKSTNTASDYASTFELLLPDSIEAVKAYVDDSKSITHDYVDIAAATTDDPNLCMLKNKYYITCRITPQYSLTKAEKEEIKEKLYKALYNGLNAQKVTFGEEIDLDYLYELAEDCDPRIKSVSIDPVKYTTYAIYYNGVTYEEVQINTHDTKPTFEYIPWEIEEDVKLNWPTVISDETTFYSKMCSDWMEGHSQVFEQQLRTVLSWDYKITHTLSGTTWTHRYYWKPSIVQDYTEITNPSEYGITMTQKPLTEASPEPDSRYTIHLPQQSRIREDIYAKSVLNGSTQLLNPENKFVHGAHQFEPTLYDSVSKITPKLTVTLHNSTTQEPSANLYTLRDNESVRFYSPNLFDKITYSDYARFEALLDDDIVSGVDHRLGADECILLYWKETSDSADVYKFAAYGEGVIIRPNGFTLNKNSGSLIGESLRVLLDQRSVPKQMTYKDVGDMLSTLSNNIAQGLGTSYNVLSGTKSINVREMNEITINYNDYYCYWVVNDVTSSGKYRLFSGEETIVSGVQTKTLGAGEYFYYTNSNLTNLVILGSGTKLTRAATTDAWEVDVVASDDIYENGTTALASHWFRIPKSNYLTAIENQYITVPSGYQFRLNLADYTTLSHETQGLDEYATVVDSSTGTTEPYVLTTQPSLDIPLLVTTCKSHFRNLGGTAGSATITFKYTNLASGEWTLDDTVIGTAQWADGLSAFGITLNSLDQPSVSLNRTYNLTVKLSNDWTVVIDSSGVDVGAYQIEYKNVKETNWTSIPTISLGSAYTWTAISTLSLNLDKLTKQHITAGQSIDVYCLDGTEVEATITGADGLQVASFLGYPIVESSSEEEVLYWYHLGKYYVLTLNCDPEIKQRTEFLVDYGSDTLITIPDRSSESIVLTTQLTQPETGTDILSHIVAGYYYPVTVYSSKSISSATPGDITTVVIDDELNKTYIGLMECKELYVMDATQEIIFNDDGTIVFRVAASSETRGNLYAMTYMTDFLREASSRTLVKPFHLIPVYTSVEDIYYQVELLSEDEIYILPPISHIGAPVVYGAKENYMLNFGVTSGTTAVSDHVIKYTSPMILKIGYTLTEVMTKGWTVKVNPFYKFKFVNLSVNPDTPTVEGSGIFPYLGDTSGSTLSTIRFILSRMLHYDPDELFDYTYVVDEDEEIQNPLEASTFFNPSHVLNKFTIGQLDTTAASKTSITFTK